MHLILSTKKTTTKFTKKITHSALARENKPYSCFVLVFLVMDSKCRGRVKCLWEGDLMREPLP